jgi:DNA helicase-2/ATP-dependent DNA helicase PcrA
MDFPHAPVAAPLRDGGALLRSLNPEQLAAVTLPDESALILAGAGSGKTRVLTTRIAWLLAQQRVSPGGILAVTFTNKAAKEMMTRLGAMLPINVRSMWIGTFHGLCNRFLRAHWKAADLPQTFQIMDSSDTQSAVKRVIKAMKLDEERFVPRQVSSFIAHCKEDGQRPGDVALRDAHTQTLVQIYAAYEAQCQREGVVDFAELLLRTYELLARDASLREHYRNRFRHILVDEFQDTNRLQYLWLKMLAGPQTAVLAVGDDDQSIYAFRGARVGNMADFEREFKVRHLVKLERNYRSSGHILDAANELISHNTQRLGKELRTDAGAGEPVRVQESASDFLEAQWVVEELQQLHRAGTLRQETAILYRSNAQSRVMESALFNAGMPYRVHGGLRFFERAEIKHALAYLRLLENGNDDTSYLRVVNFPTRGIGARTLEQLQDVARQSGRSLWQSVGAVSGRGGSNLVAFNLLIDQQRQQTKGMTLREIIELMLARSGLIDHYRTEKDGADRIENLEELVNAAEAFVTQEGFGRDAVALPVDELGGVDVAGSVGGVGSSAGAGSGVPVNLAPDAQTGEIISPLAAFLTHASLEAGDNQAQAGQEAVQLMTVHAAKGLEFDAVFITGLEEALFPHENALADADGLEEERRLMYVAITRARQRLYLSFSQTRMLHGQTRYNVKSRFVEELPEACLKWLAPRHQSFGAAPGGGFGAGFGTASSGGYQQAWQRGAGGAGAARSGWVASLAPPPAPVSRSADPSGLKPGQGVFHNKFGEGVVMTLEGSGTDARVQIHFGRHGTKWLALSVAKLTPLP